MCYSLIALVSTSLVNSKGIISMISFITFVIITVMFYKSRKRFCYFTAIYSGNANFVFLPGFCPN